VSPMRTHAGHPAEFRFADLFAGIGGARLGLEAAGGRCVFSSEWDKFARKTYAANFGDEPSGDIRQVHASQVPDHDILSAGFPCQPFSLAGVSKKRSLRMPTGFDDVAQGTLFFEIVRILRAKRPKAVLLENVKHLKSHDDGRTFETILSQLKSLGYDSSSEVLDAVKIVPQRRQRLFVVAFRRDLGLPPFVFPRIRDRHPVLSDALEAEVPGRYTINDHLWEYLQAYAKRHKASGNGFGFGLATPDGTARTLSARYHKDGAEILVRQPGRNPRRLTPRECALIMGFPKSFVIPVSDTQAYRQFGNAVVPGLIERIASRLMEWIAEGPRELATLAAR
jgi:DNA (cytosine-5)-methyltransferase 1